MLGLLSDLSDSITLYSNKEESKDRLAKQKEIIEKERHFLGLDNLTYINQIEREEQPRIYEYQTRNNYTIRVRETFRCYEFIKFINKGSFAAIALVRSKDKLYAAKVYSKKEMTKIGQLESIQNEINLLEMLNHKNIIKIIDSFTIEDDNKDEFIVIITEYYEDGSLAQLIENNGVNCINIKKIFLGIVNAVQYIHMLGIAHLDIKPDNILLDKDFNPVLCDFGFALRINITSSQNCTLQYAAPEILNRGSYNPICADIWSLGVTFFAAYTGKFPYKKLNHVNVKKALAYVSDGNLRKLIGCCFQFDVKKRATIEDIAKCEFFHKKIDCL